MVEITVKIRQINFCTLFWQKFRESNICLKIDEIFFQGDFFSFLHIFPKLGENARFKCIVMHG